MSSAPSATAVESRARSTDGGYLSGLEEELQQLAVQRAIIDDLSFAYQLQLEEVLRASADNAGLAVSPRMFAPESEECLQRRAAVAAQVSFMVDRWLCSPVADSRKTRLRSPWHDLNIPLTIILIIMAASISNLCLQVALHNAALAAQADKTVAQKVYTEQAQHVQETCRDHELAKDLHVKGDIALQQLTRKSSTHMHAPARVRVYAAPSTSTSQGQWDMLRHCVHQQV